MDTIRKKANTVITKNLVSEKPILFFLANLIVELISSQHPSALTNVEDCSRQHMPSILGMSYML